MKTLYESILSSNNASLLITIKNLFKHDSADDCEELSHYWKMLHLDIKDHKWDNSPIFGTYFYEDPKQTPLMWVFYTNTRNEIPSIVFSKICDKSYKEKVVKTLKLEKDKKDNSYIVK